MASLTLSPQSPLVLVVLVMACDTSGWSGHFLGHGRRVAVIAGQPFMSAIQLESSSIVMIEVPNLPVAGIVAPLTE